MKSIILPLSIRQVRKSREAHLSWEELGQERVLASRRQKGHAGGLKMPALTSVQGRGRGGGGVCAAGRAASVEKSTGMLTLSSSQLCGLGQLY